MSSGLSVEPIELRRSNRPLLLASSSPYRRALLEKLNVSFESASPAIDESPIDSEPFESMALRLAQQKCEALCPQFPRHLIIGSDQVAAVAGKLLQKPGDHAGAVAQLSAVSGSCAVFYTAVCVLDAASGAIQRALDVCPVRFRNLEPEVIDRYLRTEQPYDCAGSFKSEGLGIALIEAIEGGDPNALVGLPLIQLVSILAKFGVRIP